MKNSPRFKPTTNNLYGGRSETISELAHRHLTDEHHTTTDEEMLNAKVELSGDGELDEEKMAEDKDSNISFRADGEKNKGADKKSGTSNFPNPYDVISS